VKAGGDKRKKPRMTDYSAARDVLTTDRDKLVRQMADLGANESGELRSDLDFGEGFADAAAITAERTEVIGRVETLKIHLDDIDLALAQMDNDTYGVCSQCGSQISPERMEARPISRLCMTCKSSL